MTRARQRIATASAAILVQVALVALFAYSVVPGAPREAVREVMLLLRPMLRSPPPPPQLPPARVPRMIMPQDSPMPPILDGRIVGVSPAPPSALEGIGRALFGCAPERYGQLTRPEQMRCPPPGEGLARAPDLDLLSPPKSHSRDAVLWAENLAAREYTPNCIMSGHGRGTECMLRQTLAERQRAKQAMSEFRFQKAQRNAAPPPPAPVWVGVSPPSKR